MNGGKRVVIVAAVLIGGLAVALLFKKEQSETTATTDRRAKEAFPEAVQRRLATPPAESTASAKPSIPAQAFKVPTASTSAAVEATPAPPELPESYQQAFSPVGALLKPVEVDPESDAFIESPAADSAERLPWKGEEPRTHRVVDGDTLSKLAVKYLGNGDRYLEIYRLNRDVLSSPDLLPIGKVLKLPQRNPLRPLPTGAALQPFEEPQPPLVPVPRPAGN